MRVQQKFQSLLGAKTRQQREELGRLVSLYPMEFRTWAIARIKNGGGGPQAHLLLRLMHQKDLLRGLLTNPAAMPLRDAVRFAKLAQHSVKDFDLIVAEMIGMDTETHAMRALQILQHLHLTSHVVSGLAAALRNPNAKIRSLVSKLLGSLCDNPAAIRALLRDGDSRVRANTVEGLWGSNHPVAIDILRTSLRDPDNRVASNAALGLYRIGDPDGAEALRRLSAHTHPLHRISAAWCIGQTVDPELLPILDTLADDPLPKVREAARAAHQAIDTKQKSLSLSIDISQAYRTREGNLRLRAFVYDGDNNPVGLTAGSFRVFQGDASLPCRELKPPAGREALITILWLADQGLSDSVQSSAREAIFTANHHKTASDLFCVVGSGVRSTLAFSADLGQLADALNRRMPEATERPNWEKSLYGALTLAASRTHCRTVVAFSAGSALPGTLDSEKLILNAVAKEVAFHVVVFNEAPGPEWAHLAAATGGSYLAVEDQDALPDAFWRVFSQIYFANAITVGPLAESVSDAEFRLVVRSLAGFGEARFEPLSAAHRTPEEQAQLSK